MQSARWLAIRAVGVTAFAYLLFWAAIWMGNHSHAARVFSGVVPFERVIASRKWHKLGNPGGIDCTYAIVKLPGNAPDLAPTTKPSRHQFMSFGGDWNSTPAPEQTLPGTTETLLRHICVDQLYDKTWDMIDRALANPGSWYAGDHETLSVYSKPEGFAMVFRYGD